MRKLVITAVIGLLILSVGIADADTPQKITFSTAGEYKIYELFPRYVQDNASAEVELKGNIRRKGDDYYLTPLTGTITINGTRYQITMKQLKQSEPVFHESLEHQTTNNSYREEWWHLLGVAEINGDKYRGYLYWGGYELCRENYCWNYNGTFLSINGFLEGKRLRVYTEGPLPTIEGKGG